MNEDPVNNQPEIKATPEPVAANTPPVTPGEPKSPPPGRKKLYITGGVILIILLAVGLLLVLHKGNSSNNSVTNLSPGKDRAVPNVKTYTPFAVAYAFGDPSKAPAQLYLRPIGGGDRMAAGSLGASNYVTSSDVFKNQVVVVTDSGSGSKDPTTIWYSSDSGKSYSKIFVGKNPAGSGVGDQITSIKFSGDGSKVVFGFLPENGTSSDRPNTIKEINPQTKAVKDLFMDTKMAGVFIQGYDSSKGQVYYYEGCYNCDGLNNEKLLIHDISKNTDATLFDNTGKADTSTTINSSFAKILTVETAKTDLGVLDRSPYDIKEFDIKSKTAKVITTISDPQFPTAGYYGDQDIVYYSKGDSIYYVANDGSGKLLYQATKPIIGVFYVSKDLVLASSGTLDNYSLMNYNLGAKTSVNILNGDSNTNIFGLTWQ